MAFDWGKFNRTVKKKFGGKGNKLIEIQNRLFQFTR